MLSNWIENNSFLLIKGHNANGIWNIIFPKLIPVFEKLRDEYMGSTLVCPFHDDKMMAFNIIYRILDQGINLNWNINIAK